MADVSPFVVNANVRATATDGAMMRLLRASEKPVILMADKIDSERAEADASGLWNLGLGEPYPTSAPYGRGVGKLLDVLLGALPAVAVYRVRRPADPTPQVALVGHPNAGKPSLLNGLADSGCSVVSDTPDTTCDPVDGALELDGKEWAFVNITGIKRYIK